MKKRLKKIVFIGVIISLVGMMIASSIPVDLTQKVFYKDRIVGNYLFAGDIDYVEESGDTIRYWVGYNFTVERAGHLWGNDKFPDSVVVTFKRDMFGAKLAVQDSFILPSIKSKDPHWEWVSLFFLPFNVGGK